MVDQLGTTAAGNAVLNAFKAPLKVRPVGAGRRARCGRGRGRGPGGRRRDPLPPRSYQARPHSFPRSRPHHQPPSARRELCRSGLPEPICIRRIWEKNPTRFQRRRGTSGGRLQEIRHTGRGPGCRN